jgi:HAD superfamily hydrolase (TIGR01509 family)
LKNTRLAAVLWDMDGTLVDTEPYWHAAELKLVTEFGGQWTPEDQASLTGFDLRRAAAELQTRGGVDLGVDEIVGRMLDDVIAGVRNRIPWRPGARQLLEALGEQGVPCALVTMSWRPLVDAIVQGLPPSTFQATITGDEVDSGKPHPEPYLAAARALGVEAGDCVALEDSPTGLRSAVAAGCVVVAVPNEVPIPASESYRSCRSLEDLSVASLRGFVPRPRNVRRMIALAVAAAAIVAGVVVAKVVPAHTPGPTPPPTIAIDAWATSFDTVDPTLGATATPPHFREVMMAWYTLATPETITLSPNITADAQARAMSIARSANSKIVPMILDQSPTGSLAAALADPGRRAQHVDAIAKLVNDNGYDGINIDYEQFAFKESKASWPRISADFVSFLGDLAAALHPLGKTVSVVLAPIYDAGHDDASGYWVYDYHAIAPLVDRIQILAYDYSTTSPGPVAPLSYVRRAIAGARAAVDDVAKLDLAVGLFGYNWPIETVGTCPTGAQTGRTGVTQKTVGDLITKRQATPVHDLTTGEASFTYQVQFSDATTGCTQTREVHYVDVEGARQRIDLARTRFLGGVALWKLGFEDDSVTWSAISPLAS